MEVVHSYRLNLDIAVYEFLNRIVGPGLNNYYRNVENDNNMLIHNKKIHFTAIQALEV